MNLHVSHDALQDIKEIKEYISVTLCNPAAAERIVRNIVSAYSRLPDQPFMGTSLSTKINIDTPFRYLVSGNYMIIYRVTDDIEIYRIIYGRRNYIRILMEAPVNTEDEDSKE